MAIPEQVRKQSEAIAKMYAEKDAQPEAAEAVDGGVVSVASEVADSGSTSAPEPARNEQTRLGTKNDEETYEKRYKTLQGMYNADTARLRADNQQLNNRLTQLEQLLSSMSTQPQTAQTATPTKLLSDKDVEEYGDSIEIMRKVSREEASAYQQEIAELKRTINALQLNVLPRVEQVAHRQAVSSEQSFWSDLTREVPNWRDINADSAFHSWLLEVDPLTGLTRQSHLEDAQRSLDVRRVANFFSTWQSFNSPSVAQSTRDASASELAKQVVPGRSRAAGTPVDNQPKTYSPKDIAKFFDDVRKGVYRGKEAERDRIERDIFAAQRENRIVVNA